MIVYVKKFTETFVEPYVLTVEPSSTILDLKLMIQEQTPFSADQIRFIWASRGLEDDKTLSDYNIQKGSTIYMVLALRGS